MVACGKFGRKIRNLIYMKITVLVKKNSFRETKEFVYPEIINGVCVCICVCWGS